ncbi:hypothetical protein MXB_894, partial [Myxobolus squamalis]
ISVFDLSISENFSRVLCILIKKLIDVENVVSSILSQMFKDENKLHIFIFLLFKINGLAGLLALDIKRVYILIFYIRLPFDFTYKMDLGNQLMFHLSIKGPKTIDFLKEVHTHLVNMIHTSISDENDLIEFNEAIKNLFNVN